MKDTFQILAEAYSLVTLARKSFLTSRFMSTFHTFYFKNCIMHNAKPDHITSPYLGK